jgi:two-component system LytT family sensor kinase
MYLVLRIFLKSLFSIGIGIGIITYLLYGETGKLFFEYEFQAVYIVVSITALLCGWAINLSGTILNKWLAWQKYLVARFLLNILLNTTITLGIIYLAYLLTLNQNITPIQDISIYVFTSNLITKLVILIFLIVFILTIANLTFFSYKHYAVGQIESVKLTRHQYELQFEALKSQLSPHYLFNCLNTISSLVYISPEQAENYIRRLVQTYQYILNTKNKKLVTLAEELDFVNAYKFLLKVKYENALKLTVDIPESIHQSLLPPLTLQMLVENAVKHNDVSDEAPLNIKICLDHNNLITVSNSKNEKKIQDTSFKIGIENIKRRYRFFTESSVQILNSEKFSVSLPILDSNSSMHQIL